MRVVGSGAVAHTLGGAATPPPLHTRASAAAESSLIDQAYGILHTSNFNNGIDTAIGETFPGIGLRMSQNTNATGLLNALRLLVQAAQQHQVPPGPAAGNIPTTFSYDLTDIREWCSAARSVLLASATRAAITIRGCPFHSAVAADRQFLWNLHSDINGLLSGRFLHARSRNSLQGEHDEMVALTDLLLQTMSDVDTACAGALSGRNVAWRACRFHRTSLVALMLAGCTDCRCLQPIPTSCWASGRRAHGRGRTPALRARSS